ncbi:Methyltransferase domain-containing protein [Maridesulfovibrio ferrireducens]|uniref:Methyltransferase domain-containing protein n=1 Tax=Maridesulfovibrio ferrireducens TaxID=246191 RepID=A0A1G9FGS1_9BACT|nr:class I SAM-dependent methyltransferase [Maridesulfovibrio ferrireducens]SDK87578.1 Methyltransferase domain-containing protein [Maridesulfovibrio ferrireducens]
MTLDSSNYSEYWEEKGSLKNFSTPVQFDEFKKYVSSDADILDVGCGYGRVMRGLIGEGFTRVKGVEPSAALRQRLMDDSRELDVQPLENGIIPFKDQSVDAAFLVAVLTCIPDNKDQDQVMNEVYRVLKPGGVLYINDFMLNTDERNLERYDHFQKLHGTYGIFEIEGGGILRHFSDERIKELLSLFTVLEHKKVVYTTMNGNRANGFYYIGRK